MFLEGRFIMKSRTLKYTESKHPLSKIPLERVVEMQSILHDRQTISVIVIVQLYQTKSWRA